MAPGDQRLGQSSNTSVQARLFGQRVARGPVKFVWTLRSALERLSAGAKKTKQLHHLLPSCVDGVVTALPLLQLVWNGSNLKKSTGR